MPVVLLGLMLGVLANQALAGCMISTLKPCPEQAGIWLNKCPKGTPRTWACLDPKLEFPTVDCIVKDLKACGTLETNPLLLYSFGATTVQVRTQIRDVLEPRPVMFNDALPLEWDQKVLSVPRFGLKQGKIPDPGFQKRHDAFVNRFSAALAKAAKGEVIITTLNRNSEHGGSGAYSKPDPKTSKENVWLKYEFPLAQRNAAVTRVVSYALNEKPLKKVVDFEKGKNGAMLPEPNFPAPPLPKANAAPGSSKPAPGASKPAAGPSRPVPGPSKTKPGTKPIRKTRIVRRKEALGARE